MEAFKLPIIGTLFCYAKNGIKFFETTVDQLFILNPLNKNFATRVAIVIKKNWFNFLDGKIMFL